MEHPSTVCANGRVDTFKSRALLALHNLCLLQCRYKCALFCVKDNCIEYISSYLSTVGVWGLLCNLSKCDINMLIDLFSRSSHKHFSCLLQYITSLKCVLLCVMLLKNNFWRKCFTLELCFKFAMQLYRVDNVGNNSLKSS